jgi:hypothetical protein
MAVLVLLVSLVLLIVVALVCWLAGWRTTAQLATGLMWAGVATVAVGVLSVMGNWGLTRDSGYLYAQSVSHQSMQERTSQALRDSLQGYNRAIIAGAAGVICILAGSLVQSYLG